MKNIQSCHRKLRQGGRDLLAGHRTRRRDPPESVAFLLFLLQSFWRNFGMRLLSPSFVFGALRAISSFLALHLISKMHMWTSASLLLRQTQVLNESNSDWYNWSEIYVYTHKKKGEIKARETGTEFIFTPVKIFFDDNAFDDSGGVEDGGDDSEDLLKHRWW